MSTMDLTAKVFKIIFLTIIILSIVVGQNCKISNVQIENEDGRQQYIELNMKKMGLDSDESCTGLGCQIGDESKVGGNQQGYNQWTANPPTFNIVFSPGEVLSACDTENRDTSLPSGLCLSSSESLCSGDVCSLEDIEDLAEVITAAGHLPRSTGNDDLDHKIATAIVLMNLGNLDKAIETFSSVIDDDPKAAGAYLGRGAAYSRKGLHNIQVAKQAVSDLTRAIRLDQGSAKPDIYVHRAEIFLMLQRYNEAYNDASWALELQETPKTRFIRGLASLLLENFSESEADFRQNLDSSHAKIRDISHFYLGLALFYRGKIRNAIEVFKEVLKENPEHLEASLSLAQGFKELGNLRAAWTRFNQTVQSHPDNAMAYSLRGDMMFASGDVKAALSDFQRCFELDETSANCLYMKSVSQISLGRFYDGVKDATKLMVSNSPAMKASPDFIKAHYLREHARYLHSHLDSPLTSLQTDVDFPPEYLDKWVKLKPFDFKNYKEMPGLQPDVVDVHQLTVKEIPDNLKSLLCRAEDLGKLSQIIVDGVLPNKRLNLAMGLATLHLAQYLELKWKELKTVAKSNSHDKVLHGWRELFRIGLNYRRLARIDQPLLWVESLPDYRGKEGHRTDIPFVRGSVTNTKVLPYYELAFKLAKTMLEHYSGDGVVAYPSLQEEISKAQTCEDLLAVARRRQINPNGFLVSTQVPSLVKVKEDYRLDGGMLVLTEDLSQKVIFALNIISNHDRTAAYSGELDHLLSLLQDEVKKFQGSNKINDAENVISHILSIAYYFYNLLPLSKGSSAVAYSFVLGVLLSVGRQANGKIPPGRLLDMEAMLAGAPDAFVVVAKNWMGIKKSTVPLSSLPRVWEVLPTVRSVLEVLALNSTFC